MTHPRLAFALLALLLTGAGLLGYGTSAAGLYVVSSWAVGPSIHGE